jgi:Leucine-rich repeat (LRR) protein
MKKRVLSSLSLLTLSCAGIDGHGMNPDATSGDAESLSAVSTDELEAMLLIEAARAEAERDAERLGPVGSKPGRPSETVVETGSPSTAHEAALITWLDAVDDSTETLWRDVRRELTRTEAQLSGGQAAKALVSAALDRLSLASGAVYVCGDWVLPDATELSCWNAADLQLDALALLPNLRAITVPLDALTSAEAASRLTNIESVTVYQNVHGDGDLEAPPAPTLDVVAALPNLRQLSIVVSPVDGSCGDENTYSPVEVDLSPLAAVPLRSLRVDGAWIHSDHSLAIVRGLHLQSSLESLVLSGVTIPAGDLPMVDGLTELGLSDVRGVDGFALAKRCDGLTRLTVTLARGRQLAQLVRQNPGLVHLTLGGSSLSDLSALRSLTDLRHLDISNLPVRQFGFLAGLSLETLNLSNTRFKDLALLARTQTNLVDLNLSGTPLTHFGDDGQDEPDMSPLKSLSRLGTLGLSGAPLYGCEQPAAEWGANVPVLTPACQIIQDLTTEGRVQVTLWDGCGC